MEEELEYAEAAFTINAVEGSTQQSSTVDYEEAQSFSTNMAIPVSNTDGTTMAKQSSLLAVQTSSLPIPSDFLCAIMYPLGILSSLTVLFLEQQNDFVRFHAWQSFFVGFFWLILQAILIFTGFIVTAKLTVLAGSICGALLGWKAWKLSADLKALKIPILGNIAETYIYSEAQ